MFNACLGKEAASSLVAGGGILFYQTETFWGIGCSAERDDAVAGIFTIKRREISKPVPLIAADLSQAWEYADLRRVPEELYEEFWPGPLTLVVPYKKRLARLCANADNKVAIRVTSEPGAAYIAQRANAPLIATSANFAGEAPARSLAEVNPRLFRAARESGIAWGILPETRKAAFELPSTILEPVECGGKISLRILRLGAIPLLAFAGKWDISEINNGSV